MGIVIETCGTAERSKRRPAKSYTIEARKNVEQVGHVR